MKAVISVIGSASREMSQTKYRNERSCAANISELRQMKESGVWEIQNHTYNLHKITSERRGASKEPRETPSDYLKRLQGDLYRNQLFLKSVTGAAPNTVTWPFGAYTKDARSLLKEMGFCATLGCASGINRIKKEIQTACTSSKEIYENPIPTFQSFFPNTESCCASFQTLNPVTLLSESRILLCFLPNAESCCASFSKLLSERRIFAMPSEN